MKRTIKITLTDGESIEIYYVPNRYYIKDCHGLCKCIGDFYNDDTLEIKYEEIKNEKR